MSTEIYFQAAEENVQKFLGDLPEEVFEDTELFYEEVYTLAFDGAFDAGAMQHEAAVIAQEISSRY